jgi:hypothetical protein
MDWSGNSVKDSSIEQLRLHGETVPFSLLTILFSQTRPDITEEKKHSGQATVHIHIPNLLSNSRGSV